MSIEAKMTAKTNATMRTNASGHSSLETNKAKVTKTATGGKCLMKATVWLTAFLQLPVGGHQLHKNVGHLRERGYW